MKSTPEAAVQRQIKNYLTLLGHTVFRANVGMLVTPDGRLMSTGLPVGFPDLFGFRKGDAKAFFIEVKAGRNKPTASQKEFIANLQAAGALAGVAYSIEDATKILGGNHGEKTRK